MQSSKENSEGLIPAHGGYRKLFAYQKAEIIYDGTVYSQGVFLGSTTVH